MRWKLGFKSLLAFLPCLLHNLEVGKGTEGDTPHRSFAECSTLFSRKEKYPPSPSHRMKSSVHPHPPPTPLHPHPNPTRQK